MKVWDRLEMEYGTFWLTDSCLDLGMTNLPPLQQIWFNSLSPRFRGHIHTIALLVFYVLLCSFHAEVLRNSEGIRGLSKLCFKNVPPKDPFVFISLRALGDPAVCCRQVEATAKGQIRNASYNTLIKNKDVCQDSLFGPSFNWYTWMKLFWVAFNKFLLSVSFSGNELRMCAKGNPICRVSSLWLVVIVTDLNNQNTFVVLWLFRSFSIAFNNVVYDLLRHYYCFLASCLSWI